MGTFLNAEGDNKWITLIQIVYIDSQYQKIMALMRKLEIRIRIRNLYINSNRYFGVQTVFEPSESCGAGIKDTPQLFLHYSKQGVYCRCMRK